MPDPDLIQSIKVMEQKHIADRVALEQISLHKAVIPHCAYQLDDWSGRKREGRARIVGTTRELGVPSRRYCTG